MTLPHYNDAALTESGWTDAKERKAFIAFMRRADALIGSLTGMGVEDFADADWAMLFEDTDGKATPQDVIDLLSDADPLFAAMAAL